MDTMTYRKRQVILVSLCLITALILAGCDPAALGIVEDTETPTPIMVPVPGATTAPVVTLNVSSNVALGSYLTDQAGFTLYFYKNDTPKTSHCTGSCLQTWPGLMTSGAPKAGDPAIKGKLGWINRPDGGQQVTFNDMPLYYYTHDDIPGDTKGVGMGSGWVVAQLPSSVK